MILHVTRERERKIQRLSHVHGTLWHGRHEQLTQRRARRQLVQRRRQEVIVPRVQGRRPEVVDDGEDGPIAAILGVNSIEFPQTVQCDFQQSI